eukprot:scaffold10351_cov62-Phaeocystis_antarctica.AAC.10
MGGLVRAGSRSFPGPTLVSTSRYGRAPSPAREDALFVVALPEHLLVRLLDAVLPHLIGLVLGRRREAHLVDGEAEEADERQASPDAQHEEPAIPLQQDHEERDGLPKEGKPQQRQTQPRHEGDGACCPPAQEEDVREVDEHGPRDEHHATQPHPLAAR